MNKRNIIKSLENEQANIYKGLLTMNSELGGADTSVIEYKFNEPQYLDLIRIYSLVKIAGEGSEFIKMQRLLNHFAPKLKHASMYANHISMDALSLLEYSYNKPKQGINCLSKSKILQECALALGIHARRVAMLPFNPYDLDNHVVVEIYDKELRKWIMLDPSTNTWVEDKEKTPLSLIEVRNNVINNSFVSVVTGYKKMKQSEKDDLLTYYIKNLFYFSVDQVNGCGDFKRNILFYPAGFNLNKREKSRLAFRYNYFSSEKDGNEVLLNKVKAALESFKEVTYPNYNLSILTKIPQ